jgi:Pvc16 N-terminal domain/CarboxypepD_reg-like domain
MALSGQTVISDLDKTLKQLFQSEFGTTLPFDLSFAIPDNNFTPMSQKQTTLDCYLYEINEDRELRSVTPMLQRNIDGTIEKELPPARIKLSYCITAWSPAQPTPDGEPQLDEHTLLSQVLEVLLKYPTLPGGILQGTLAGQDPLPCTTAVLPDTSKSTSDFWSAIGGQLRPSVDYKVTVSLTYQTPSKGPMVTTMVTSFGSEGPFYTIGGTVRDSRTPPNALASAWVRVNETGQTYMTDEAGQFLISQIAAGNYTLAVRAVGFKEGGRSIQVPQPDGLYDVSLTLL